MRTKIFNITYEPDITAVHNAIEEHSAGGKAGFICVADGNILTMVHSDLDYRRVVDESEFAILDSSWVPLYAKRLYGYDWTQYCGSQIFDDVTKMRKYRQYFLGTSEPVLAALKAKLLDVDPAIENMKFVELPFCSADGFDYGSIAEAVNEDAPDVIWVALGAPKQEIFASRLAPLLNKGIIIPVGAVFNFRAGLGIKRAPAWMVKCHLEFLYRIFSEPKKQIARCWRIVKALPSIYFEEKRK